MDIKKWGVDWIQVAQIDVQWRILLNTLGKLFTSKRLSASQEELRSMDG
jgi:hypothetical protein